MTRALLPLLLAAAACDTGFQHESIVVDLRVLAMRTDPAEVVVDFDPSAPTIPEMPPVKVTALIGDPAGPRPLVWALTACPERFERRCDPDLPSVRFAEGTTTSTPEATLEPDVSLLQAALQNDDFLGLGGVPVQLVLTIRPSDAPQSEDLYAGKLIFYAPRVPDDRVANQNPTMSLTADGNAFGPDAPLEVAVGTEVQLEPVEPAGIRETYSVPTLDGDVRTFTENMRYSWLATAGDFSNEHTGGPTDVFGNVPLLRTKWKAPDAAGPVTLWVVQRDERGGTFWLQRSIQVR